MKKVNLLSLASLLLAGLGFIVSEASTKKEIEEAVDERFEQYIAAKEENENDEEEEVEA